MRIQKVLVCFTVFCSTLLHASSVGVLSVPGRGSISAPNAPFEHLQSQVTLQGRAQQLLEHRVVDAVRTKWNYWGFGMSAGIGIVSIHRGSQREDPIMWPDFRVSLERSFSIGDSTTLSLDLALLTPTVRLGYLIGDRVRVGFGLGWWVLGNAKVQLKWDDTDLADNSKSYSITNTSRLTPSFNIDCFISKRNMFRFVLSYDHITLHDSDEELISVYWPQLSVGLVFTF